MGTLFSVILVAVSWAALKLIYTGKEPPKRHSTPTALPPHLQSYEEEGN